ncbi:adhesion G-protein coupled receptor G7-like [Branchiostoma floridae x Branchiostoma belcheri]
MIIFGMVKFATSKASSSYCSESLCILQIVVNNETALSVATELQLITTQAETLSSGDVDTVIATLQQIVNASATEQIGDSLLTTVDNLFKVNVTVLQQSQGERGGPTRAVQALETFADTVILTNETYTAVRPRVALQAADISPEELDKGQGFAFSMSGNDSDSLTEGDVRSFTTEVGGDIQQTADISISLPPNISSMIQIKNMSDVRLSYTLYNSSSLFVQLSQGAVGRSQSATVPSQGAVGTRIIGGRIAGRRVKDLPEPVITTFVRALQESFVPEDMREVKCVFWDFDADSWSTERCESMGENMGRYTCACNHLTNFAIIFDVSGEGFGDHEKPLEVITIVGCVVSIVCLVLTLFSFVVTRRDKRRTRTGHAKNQRLVLINLCVALLAILVIFLAGINRTASPIGCKVVAALLHYFLLAALMWMAMEAVNLYRAVVQVFDAVSANFVIKAGAVAWGFPLVATLSTAGPSSLYKYRMEKACWLAREPLIYAFLIPAGLILLFNLLVFILVMTKLVREEKKQKGLRGAAADANKVDRQWIILQIRRAGSIMALFGLTWLFGFFVIDDARTVFAYLFCIFNTLQGLFIFIFHCVMREDMTKWRKKLTCWKKFIYIGKKKQGQYQVNGSKSFSSASQTSQTILIGLSTLSLDTKPNPKSL